MEPTDCAKKLKQFLDDNGIRYTWFAEKIGISQPTLSGYLAGKRPLPRKAFKKVVLMTKGKISMKELLNEFFRDVEDDNTKEDEEM